MRDDRTRLIIRALGYASLLIVAILVGRAQLLRVAHEPAAVGTAPPETLLVVVARADLSPGTRIGASVLHTAEWPSGELPAGAFVSIEALEGRVLRHAVPRGQPILESSLLPRVPVQVVAV